MSRAGDAIKHVVKSNNGITKIKLSESIYQRMKVDLSHVVATEPDNAAYVGDFMRIPAFIDNSLGVDEFAVE